MSESEREAATARARALEAELASDAAASAGTAQSHHLAVELHTDAAKWCRRTGAPARAHRHQTWAKLHAQLAARIIAEDE